MAINLGGLGAFLGGNNGQGGFVNPIAAALQKQREQQQQAAALNMLRSAISPPQGGAGFSQMPPGMAGPGQPPPGGPPQPAAPGGVMPMPPQGAPPMMPPSPGGAAPPGGGQPPQPSGQPPSPTGGQDIVAKQQAMMMKILDTPGPAASKVQALQMIGAYLSPVEKMQMQFEQNMAKLQNQQSMLDEKLKNLVLLKQMGGQQSSDNIDKRTAAGEEKTSLQDLEKNVTDTRSFAQSFVNAGKVDSTEYKEAKQAYLAAVQAKKDYVAGQKKGVISGGKPAPSSPSVPAAGVPLPKEMKDSPDGSTVPDEDGKLWKKQGNQLVPAG